MAQLARVPELWVAFYSFVFHFVWEMLQVPAYAGMSAMPHWDGVLVCTQATIGDVGFALTAFWSTAMLRRSRNWMQSPTKAEIAVFLAVGVLMTVAFEYYYVEITGRWTYASWLPLVPPLGTGLSPLLQWVLIPLLVLGLSRRQLRSV
ncbi:MAG: hypothetical protein AB7I59_09545 [Geminicoccaceae bacterium]